MRKALWFSLVLLVLAITVVNAFLLLRRLQPPPAAGLARQPASVARLETQDVPPRPNVSLQINSAHELEVFQGTPLIFTVRVANQRAANAASLLQAHEAYLSLIGEKLGKKEISARDAMPMVKWRARNRMSKLFVSGPMNKVGRHPCTLKQEAQVANRND